MKIGINGRPLLDPYTGIGQYTINLLREFAKMAEKSREQNEDRVEFLVAVPDETCAALLKTEGIHIPTIILPEVHWLGRRDEHGGLAAGLRKHIWEQIQLPRFFRNYRDDDGTSVNRIFLPYVCPPWMRFLWPKEANIFMTVHDAIPWKFPDYQRGIASKLAHTIAKRSISNVDHLITVSNAAARDIADATGISQDIIHVIYNAPADVYFSPIEEDAMRQTLQAFGLEPRQYILYVGGYDARKRVKQLIEACKQFPQYPLVLAGGAVRNSDLYSDFSSDFLASEAADSLTTPVKKPILKIVKTGFLEDVELAAMYRGARAFLHFSASEGFNIPVTEAMAHHIPMLLSDIPVHREIAQNAALYVDVENDREVQLNLDRLLSDESTRRTLTERAADMMKYYSWRKSADEHFRLLTTPHYERTAHHRHTD